jgi:uncharacterized protein (TIGR04222 family)
VNPFDLRGPQFLLLYAVVGLAVLGSLALARILREGGPSKVRLTDPYLIGCLRGGVPEALRLVVVSLVDRELLERTGRMLTTRPGAADRVRHPLERAVLQRFLRTGEASTVFDDADLAAAAEPLRETAVRVERQGRLLLALAVLAGLAGIKVMTALERGHTNVLFLLLLAALFCGLAFGVGLRTRTVRGEMTLADLRTLFERHRGRAAHLQADARDEALLVAAVFGLGVLPSPWAYTQEFFPRAAKSDGTSSGGSSCGTSSSSCGSSSSGSSCGGGGCGGGCGGCGS